MAEQRENIGNIYPNLPYVVLEKIKKYHRLANAEVEPKKTVLGELKNNIQLYLSEILNLVLS